MSSKIELVITSNGTALDFKSQCNLAPLGSVAINNFIDYLAGVVSGSIIGANFVFGVGAVRAVGSITQTSTGAANGETLTVAGVTFTARTSGATGNEWNRSDTVATSATNLAAAINASTDTNPYVIAEAAAGVVTVTVLEPGVLGNLVTITESCSNTSRVTPVGGLNGTQYTINCA
jgi:hypothetical protein